MSVQQNGVSLYIPPTTYSPNYMLRKQKIITLSTAKIIPLPNFIRDSKGKLVQNISMTRRTKKGKFSESSQDFRARVEKKHTHKNWVRFNTSVKFVGHIR